LWKEANSSDGGRRGLLIDYETLPGALLHVLYPLWGLIRTTSVLPLSSPRLAFTLKSAHNLERPPIEANSVPFLSEISLTPIAVRRMITEAKHYSKNTPRISFFGLDTQFQGDSTAKEDWANQEIKRISEVILEELY
jgi:hypothetical protein